METILVTGGAGFIGSHVCDELLKTGKKVICLDNFNDYYNPKIKERNISHNIDNENFVLEKIDIINKGELEKVFERNKVDKIIHLAARAGVRPSIKQPELYFRVNVTGTFNLLETAAKFMVKKFVFGSSSSVYGNNKKIPFSEEDKTENQISPYASTKKIAELLCKTYSTMYDLDIVCLRFFTVYGPRGRPDMATYKFTDAIYNGRTIEMYGDGSSERDYTYIEDIVKGVVSALDLEKKFEIINLGNSDPIKLNEYINTIEKIIGKKAIIEKKPMPQGDVNVTYADISKAKKLLNYEPATKIGEGIKKFFEWYQEKI